MNDINLNDVRYFLKIVDLGSLSAAATYFSVPKSKLSRRINSLEQQLGMRLFDRMARPLAPTEIGTLVHQRYTMLFEELDQAEDVIRAQQSTPSGQLRISLPSDLVNTVVGETIPTFCQSYPEITVSCHLSTQPHLFAIDDFDVAINITPGELLASDYISRRLITGPMGLYAAPELLSRLPQITQVEQLRSLPCLTTTYIDHWRFNGNRKEMAIPISGPLRIDSLSALLNAGLQGLGIVRLPPVICKSHLESGTLVALQLDAELAEYWINLFYKERTLIPAKVRVFIDYFKLQLCNYSSTG